MVIVRAAVVPREAKAASKQRECVCPCAFCSDDEHIRCSNRRCGIGQALRSERPG